MSVAKLYYWGIPGRAEVIKLAFHVGDIKFEDAPPSIPLLHLSSTHRCWLFAALNLFRAAMGNLLHHLQGSAQPQQSLHAGLHGALEGHAVDRLLCHMTD
jgi:hypothetical protein